MFLDEDFDNSANCFESKRQHRQRVLNGLNKNHWVAAAVAVVGAYSEYRSQKKNRGLIKGQIQFQKDQNALFREDFKPFLQTGRKANTLLDQILLQGDTSSLQGDPVLQEQLQETTQRSNRSAAARGRLGSGANAVDIFRRSGNVYNTKINQLMALSGRGQAGALAQGQINQQSTSGVVNSVQGLVGVNNAQGRNQQNLISGLYQSYLQGQKKGK